MQDTSPAFLSLITERLRTAGCVFAEDEARLLASVARTPADLTAMADRRAAGSPLELVVGWAEFCGRRVVVEPGVFVPRRRTEFLVRCAVGVARQEIIPPGGPGRSPDPVVVVDLCCGAGAVGAALAAALGPVDLHATDIDPAAVACARRNVTDWGGRVYQGDLYDPLPAALAGRVGVLVANAPYVPTAAVGLLPAEARLHEPRVALDGGPDGLDVLRRVIAGAPRWLADGGHLLFETSENQAASACTAAAASGLAARAARDSELNATVIIATKPITARGIGAQG